MASHKHTLRMYGDELDKNLADLCGSVLSCSCLKMLPDMASNDQEQCYATVHVESLTHVKGLACLLNSLVAASAVLKLSSSHIQSPRPRVPSSDAGIPFDRRTACHSSWKTGAHAAAIEGDGAVQSCLHHDAQPERTHARVTATFYGSGVGNMCQKKVGSALPRLQTRNRGLV